jgi:hypothetical protein
VKDMQSGDQVDVALDRLVAWLAARVDGHRL